mgnify:CR=1 FL=1
MPNLFLLGAVGFYFMELTGKKLNLKRVVRFDVWMWIYANLKYFLAETFFVKRTNESKLTKLANFMIHLSVLIKS